jgi:hypothetical protein
MTSIRLRLRNAETTRLEEEIHDLRGPAVLGRSRDADILLSDPGVSRRHASLRPGEDGGWLIEDLHSTRGTSVNGRRMAPGEFSKIVEGDLIEINPWSMLVLGHETTGGVLLDGDQVGGEIAEAFASPHLRHLGSMALWRRFSELPLGAAKRRPSGRSSNACSMVVNSIEG